MDEGSHGDDFEESEEEEQPDALSQMPTSAGELEGTKSGDEESDDKDYDDEPGYEEWEWNCFNLGIGFVVVVRDLLKFCTLFLGERDRAYCGF